MIMKATQPPDDRAAACLDAELLASYVDGQASREERDSVEAHLARCEDCYFAFAETFREQLSGESGASKGFDWRRWVPRTAAGLAAAAAIVVAVVVGTRNDSAPEPVLASAVNALDAAAGPYRKFEPRVTTLPTYRELEPVTRSAARTSDTPPALLEAAAIVEKAARPGTSVAARRALAAMYLAQGRAAPAADALAPLAASASEAGLLNDVAAAYLSRQGDEDARYAFDLLERAVVLDPACAEAWFNLGLAAEWLGRTPRAREAWTRYLELDPSSGWSVEARRHLDRLAR